MTGSVVVSSEVSDKSRGIATLLCAVIGVFGAHRFYAGKVGSGVLMACTLGGMGIWWLYDLIVVASGGFRDADGRPVLDWEFESRVHPAISDDVLRELDHLRREMAELQERMDFNERLLANVRREEGANPDER
jgi:TM2 domain-containing membrane protein YozV